jgi:hypothetical protein
MHDTQSQHALASKALRRTPAAFIDHPSLTSSESIAAYTRSSSRPVDMVFSLMDLLGVQDDVAQFGKDDCMKATVVMIQALMLRLNATATWLFIAPAMTPSRELSALLEMPETRESGWAYIQTSRGRVLASKAMGTGVEACWRAIR